MTNMTNLNCFSNQAPDTVSYSMPGTNTHATNKS